MIRQTTTNNSQNCKEGISIKNAGLVLFNTYLPLLFERLNLMQGNQFKNEEAQMSAVNFTQYLVTGIEKTEEPF